MGDLMTIFAGALLFLSGQGSSAWFPRRQIERAAGGPMGSTMMGYYNYGDEQTFLYNFRMTRDQLEGGHRMLAEYFKAAADCASLGESTVEGWMVEFCTAILAIMAPIYLLWEPPSSHYIEHITSSNLTTHWLSP